MCIGACTTRYIVTSARVHCTTWRDRFYIWLFSTPYVSTYTRPRINFLFISAEIQFPNCFPKLFIIYNAIDPRKFSSHTLDWDSSELPCCSIALVPMWGGNKVIYHRDIHAIQLGGEILPLWILNLIDARNYSVLYTYVKQPTVF